MPLIEQGEEQGDHQHAPYEQRPREVGQGQPDEVSRPEDIRVDLYPREARLERFERCIDPPRYVERVAPRELFHHQQKPRTSVDDGISDQRLMALHDIGDIAQFAHVAGFVLERNLGKVLGGDDGQHMTNTESLIRRINPSPGSQLRGDSHKASPALFTTSSRATPWILSCWGFTRTCNSRSRKPQIETLATPGTPISLGPIVHRAKTESCTVDSLSDMSPMAMTLLVDESVGNMTGGSETFGRAFAWVSRSCTICRAAIRSVPGSKFRRIDDSPSIVWDWMF